MMLPAKLLMWVILAAIIAGNSCSQIYPFNYSEAMKKGGECYIRGDYESAAEFYGKALRLAERKGILTDRLVALGSLARVHSAQGNNELAESEWKTRVSLSGESELDVELLAESHVDLIMFYLRTKRCDDAHSLLQQFKENPNINNSAVFKESEDMINAYINFKGAISN